MGVIAQLQLLAMLLACGGSGHVLQLALSHTGGADPTFKQKKSKSPHTSGILGYENKLLFFIFVSKSFNSFQNKRIGKCCRIGILMVVVIQMRINVLLSGLCNVYGLA